MTDWKAEDLLARLHEIEEKGWWRDRMALVSETDQPFAVIEPYGDGSAEDLRLLGQVLEDWKTEFPQARHIWGLTDLLQGHPPRTPPIYLSVPYPTPGFENCYEPVALVFVAEGTDLEIAAKSLSERLNCFGSKLARFEHPDTYSFYQR